MKLRREVRRTALIYAEGLHDDIFMGHLKQIYQARFRGPGPVFTVRKGKGGDQISIVQEATTVRGEYDAVFVKLDADRPKREMRAAADYAKRAGIVLLQSDPCLEALLLNIVVPGTDASSLTTAQCKRSFEANHIPANRRASISHYRRVFSRRVLDEARPRVPELDSLIRLIETGEFRPVDA